MRRPRAPVVLLLGAMLLAGSLVAASPSRRRDRDDPPPISYTTVTTSQKGACSGAPVNCPKPSRAVGAIRAANLCEGQDYGEAIKPYVVENRGGQVILERNMGAWRRTMARWVPCLIENLKSPSPRTRAEVIKLLDKLRDPRVVEPLLEMLERVPEDGSDAWTARRSLSCTFKARKVIPILEKAARNPRNLATGMAGYFGGVRDKRLLEITLDRFEEWYRRYSADGRYGFGFWNELVWQAAVQPDNLRLKPVVIAALNRGDKFSLSGVLPLVKVICSVEDCSWFRDAVVHHVDGLSGKEPSPRYLDLITLLCQEAPEGEDLGFLQQILHTGLGATSRLRHSVSSLLLERSCRKEGPLSSAEEMRECMAAIERENLKTVSPRTAVGLIEATCGNAANGKADPDCWASFKALFRGNPAMEDSLAIHEAGALLLAGEQGFERAGKLLETIDPDEVQRLCDRHTNWIYEKASQTYEHLRWKATNSQGGREIVLEGPASFAAGAWVFTLRGPSEVLESLAGVPVVAFAWFGTRGAGEEGRTVSVRILDREKAWISWEVEAIPFPDPVGPDHDISRLQMIFLGKAGTQPRLVISWAKPGAGPDKGEDRNRSSILSSTEPYR